VSASVCLYVCANKQRVQTSQIFVRATCDRVLLVVLSFYGVAVSYFYVLPVLWMTSCLDIMTGIRGYAKYASTQSDNQVISMDLFEIAAYTRIESLEATSHRGRSLLSTIALLAVEI